VFVLAPPVHDQVLPDSGVRVRITSPEVPHGRAVGALERFTRDTILVAGLAISRASIGRFEVSAGQKSHLLAGMGIGFAVGTAVGALTGFGSCSQSHPNSDDEVGKLLCVLAFSGAGGGTGLLIGGLVGSTRHSDRWRTVSLSSVRIAPMFRPNLALEISLGFSF
jgi:hypothetical protein